MRILVSLAAALWLMATLRDVLLPLVVAVLVWFILSAVSQKVLMLAPAPFKRGKTAARAVSVVGVFIILVVIGLVVQGNVATLIENADAYKTNLDKILEELSGIVQPLNPMDLDAIAKELNLRSIVLQLAGSGASYLASLFTALIYLIFVFAEADAFEAKVSSLTKSTGNDANFRQLFKRIKSSIDEFFYVTVIIGVMQAVPTFLVLWLMGVDAPVLWAVLVFLFSFIPTIGTIFGIVFPVLMTALQFAAWEPVVIVLACLGTVQLVCTNLILPKMMSQSLNLSPLVVMVAVFGGAAIWGIVGALIAVPALTMALIICMQKSSLNYVAVLLSANGELASDRDQWPSAGQEP